MKWPHNYILNQSQNDNLPWKIKKIAIEERIKSIKFEAKLASNAIISHIKFKENTFTWNVKGNGKEVS